MSSLLALSFAGSLGRCHRAGGGHLPGSPAENAGKVVDGFTLWYLDKAPDAGAYEGSGRVYGTPMEHQSGPSYEERPRIVRVMARGAHLVIFFSTDLSAATLTPSTVSVAIDGSPAAVQA